MKKGLLSIVVPCYNEEQVLDLFYSEIKKVLNKIEYDYEIIFIDDGSTDHTPDIVKDIHKNDKQVSLISFSRNFGKEAGIYAGLSNAKGDLIVVMDADLQHQPKVLLEMLKYIEEGYDTVTTQRIDREGESFLKRIFSNLFYSIMNRFTDVNLVKDSQDFRLMKRIVVDAILNLKEYNRFSKGIFSWVGFKTKYIKVDNVERPAGDTKWNFRTLFNYAIEGILAFSTVPLRFATIIGILISFGAFLLLLQVIIEALFFGIKEPGYPSMMAVILFIGGIQILLIGVVSEYIAKIYYEIKSRPKYIIREYIKPTEREG
ncbi:glycosyltransferase family 2 protein [Paramaledivibacter caminithermalis]|uniref:Glycosyltransferase involved in cell wall bisynthesis n=1 Tax=Paramaledivibacter caminithermalis (strain DSM 15212 / CIP 107654 / DViRD3) TaxID=1121301 RepID=A0A1M6LZ04_PARC5|nr:glycosyltransferase family 2 protein [Paramaledivibacter caminithermalis]SHJ76439.1 Glycosyltransferase involved in cell wall bisynthesis [Paramaledivibacter caminithermalis DSM 15212]